jgi:hypothetical protein
VSWPKGKKNSGLSKRNRESNPIKKGNIPWNKGKSGCQIAWNKGKNHSETTKQKISKDAKRRYESGNVHPMLGRNHSDEARNKMKKSNKKVWLGRKRPDQSQLMRNGLAAHCNEFIKNPSKPQVKLFEMIKLLYPSAILNYPHKNYSIDIVIPELKIAIEYDEPYWHKGREEYDRNRQIEIEKGGWKFFRYKKLPNDNKLNEDLGDLK